ncbi:MAG: hypothetical protein WC260_02630 [Candidatus Pacearchaeota archaeon]
MNYLKSILLFILLLVFVNFSLAYPDLILENKNPQPRENIYGYISDAQLLSNVLNKEDFYFYEGRAPIKPTEYNLIKYNEGYYFYLKFNKEGNYTIKSNELLYQSPNGLSSRIVELNLTVKTNYNKDEKFPLLEIKPGFIYGYEVSNITLLNSGTASLELEYNKTKFTLSPGGFQTITNYPLNKTFTLFKIKTYKDFSYPILYLGELKKEETKSNLRISPEEIKIEMAIGNDRIKKNILQLINNFDYFIENISFIENIEILTIQNQEFLDPNNKTFVTFYINSEKETYVNEEIYLTYTENKENYSITIPIEIFVYPKGTSLDNPNESLKDRLTCSEMNGQFCSKGYACAKDDLTFSSEGMACCLSKCVLVSGTDDFKEKSSSAWIIGVIILLVLAGVGYYFYNKYNKIKKGNSTKNILGNLKKK